VTWGSKVMWSEGMFLRPQHFQQQDRYFQRLIEGRCQGLRPYDWGFQELEIDQVGLELGRVGLLRARGIFPDGTPFSIPDDLPAPPPLLLDDDLRDQIVYLSVPLRRSGQEETSRSDVGPQTTRYSSLEASVRDSNVNGSGDVGLEICRENLALLPEASDLGPYAVIAVCRVLEKRTDGSVTLDETYIPTVMNYAASSGLVAIVSELSGKLSQTAMALAERVSLSRQSASDLASFLRLQLVNRYRALFVHWDGSPMLHPEDLYCALLELAGELATYTRETRLCPQFPAYQHVDIRASFDPLMEELRRGLAVSFEENVIRLPLEDRRFGISLSPIADHSLLTGAIFVLEVAADMPDERLRQTFPTHVKVAPKEDIEKLVNLALLGIALDPLPAAPRQLPFHAGASYFKLQTGGEYWGKLQNSSAIAFHVAGKEKFPGLKMTFWAIKGG